MSGETILIVDDDPASITLMRTILAREGYSIQSAESADEALAALRSFVPRLILMDIQLPGTDGLALAQEIKVIQPCAKYASSP